VGDFLMVISDKIKDFYNKDLQQRVRAFLNDMFFGDLADYKPSDLDMLGLKKHKKED
jgi:hypothetical protein